MILHNIRWKNFLSTGNQWTEIDLSSHPMTLIIGENGSGKSTLLDALSFVLFGKPFRKINKPQLVNTITGKNLVVECSFAVGVNVYKIIRGIKPTVFEVYKNDKLIDQDREKGDYQEVLESHIIKVNHKTFCSIGIIGAATFKPFMQLTAAQRRDFIEDLLGLKIFTTMNTLLKDRLSATNEQIDGIDKQIASARRTIDAIVEQQARSNKNSEQLIENKLIKINSLSEEINVRSEQLVTIKSTHAKKVSHISTHRGPLLKKKKDLENLRVGIVSNISAVKNSIQFYEHNSTCPTCSQSIDLQFKEQRQCDNNAQHSEYAAGLQQLDKQLQKVNTKLAALDEEQFQVNEFEADMYALTAANEAATQSIQLHQSDIESLQKNTDTGETNVLAPFEQEIEVLQQQRAQHEEQKNVLIAGSSLLKDGGIKSKIVKQYIPVINQLISKYLAALDFFVQFELDETFSETIKSRYRDDFSYDSFSEGEKMRIDLAVLFAWRAIAKMRNSIETNILIMDEIFESSLNQSGIDRLMEILRTSTDDTNLFVISHQVNQLYDVFPNVIKFEKYKNFSGVVK